MAARRQGGQAGELKAGATAECSETPKWEPQTGAPAEDSPLSPGHSAGPSGQLSSGGRAKEPPSCSEGPADLPAGRAVRACPAQPPPEALVGTVSRGSVDGGDEGVGGGVSEWPVMRTNSLRKIKMQMTI